MSVLDCYYEARDGCNIKCGNDNRKHVTVNCTKGRFIPNMHIVKFHTMGDF